MSDTNPFEGSHGSDHDLSSGDEITRIFEANDTMFNFEKWIDKYNLGDIMNCFKDHDMISLETLNLNNPNFSKLMADQRVILKAHLIQNIVNGIQSLNALRENKSKESSEIEAKEGVLPDTATTAPQKKKINIVIMTEHESKTFKNMDQYIENLSNLRNELSIVTQQDLEIARDRNYEQIEEYQEIHLTKLDQITDNIRNTFHKLHFAVDKTKQTLIDKVNRFEEEINDIKTDHDQITDVIDGKYKHCLSIIDKDKKIFKESMTQNKDIIKKYDDENTNQFDTEDFSFKNINKNREKEIIQIGNAAKNQYEQTMLLLDDEQKEIDHYIKSELNVPQNDMYSVSVHSNVYNAIVRDLNQLIQIQNNEESVLVIEDQKMQQNNGEVKMVDEDHKQQINGNEVGDEDMLDDAICCVEFKQRPLGLTFGTDENKKNLFVTTIDENSIAFHANVSIGSKLIKLQDEMVEDLGSSAIYKLLNNKFGKVLPLKITFSAPNEVDDIKFDKKWFNEEKWELDDEDDGDKTIKGIHYDPFTAYCVYFANDGYSKGVHYLTVKGTKLNEEQGNVKCCIGVISEKNKDWTIKGINDNWPKIGTYSYFDGWAEDPYWYSSESITVKLDVTNLMVYYFTVQQSKQKLIKKQKINKAKTYHFMISADSDPTVQYMIK